MPPISVTSFCSGKMSITGYGVSGLISSYYFGTSAGGTIVLFAAIIYFITFFIGRKKKA